MEWGCNNAETGCPETLYWQQMGQAVTYFPISLSMPGHQKCCLMLKQVLFNSRMTGEDGSMGQVDHLRSVRGRHKQPLWKTTLGYRNMKPILSNLILNSPCDSSNDTRGGQNIMRGYNRRPRINLSRECIRFYVFGTSTVRQDQFEPAKKNHLDCLELSLLAERMYSRSSPNDRHSFNQAW